MVGEWTKFAQLFHDGGRSQLGVQKKKTRLVGVPKMESNGLYGGQRVDRISTTIG